MTGESYKIDLVGKIVNGVNQLAADNDIDLSAEENASLFDSLAGSNTEKDYNLVGSWSKIQPEENSFLTGESIFNYMSSNGVMVTTKSNENTQVLENNETGEIIIIGADEAKVYSIAADTPISIYDSNIDTIQSLGSDDNFRIYNSSVGNIDTGNGTDSIIIENSSVKGVINTGYGNDFVSISNSEILGLNTSTNSLFSFFDDGEDTVILDNIKAVGISTGNGNDNIISTSSNLDILNTGGGSNSLSLSENSIQTLNTNGEDIIIENGNYFNFDKSKILEIESDAQVSFKDGSSLSLKDYTSYVFSQEIGFETDEEYQQYTIDTLTSNLEMMKTAFQNQEDSDGIVSDGYNALKKLTNMGISSEDIQSVIAEQERIIDGLQAAINGQSSMSFEEAYKYYTGTEYSQEKFDKYMDISNTYLAVIAGCQYDEDYPDKFENATGMSIEEISKEFALCQLETFGVNTALQDLVNKYIEDQESFIGNISGAITDLGIGCIAVGSIVSFVFPPAGAALMNAGRFISLGGMFLDNVLNLVDDATDNDGLTQEEISDIAVETGVEVVAYAAGRGIGKFTSGLNPVVSTKAASLGFGGISSRLAGQATETAMDTVLSLGADYAITQGQSFITTGEFMDADDYWSMDRFFGEGKNQLIGILTGLASSKVNAYQQGLLITAQEKVLNGDIQAARDFLDSSGMITSDADFEYFVRSVNEAEIIKSQYNSEPETVNDSRSNLIVNNLSNDTSTEKQISKDNTNVKTSQGKIDIDTRSLEEIIAERISGIQPFADIDEYVRSTEYVYKRLTDNGVQIAMDDILNISDKFNYDNQVNFMVSMSAKADNMIGKMYILSELMDKGLLDYNTLKSLTPDNWTKAITFKSVCTEYFEDAIKASGLEDKLSDYNEIAVDISKGNISTDVAKRIMNGDQFVNDLLDYGVPKSWLDKVINDDNLRENLYNLYSEANPSDGWTYEYSELQNDAGIEIIAIKAVGENEESNVVKAIKINNDGEILRSTSEGTSDGLINNWYYNSDRTTIITFTENTPSDIQSQIEIVNDDKGEPSYILYSKKSDELEGLYVTTKYNLMDYPEDFDILSSLKNQTIDADIEANGYKQGEKLTNVTKDINGNLSYIENFEQDGILTNRNYNQKVDKNGNISSYQYQYNITDGENNNLLTINKSWIKNANGSTTTINGKTYEAKFNDTDMKITVTQEDGTVNVIPVKDMLAEKQDYLIDKFGSIEAGQEVFWEFMKTLPGDQLINLQEQVNKIYIVDSIESAIDHSNKELYIGLDSAVLFHELGHAIDLNGADSFDDAKISQNKELIDIYNSEYENFKSEYPEMEQNIIEYFSQTGGGLLNSGLSELVAETNMLVSTYGHSTSTVQTRAQYLVKYFPKTLAKIAELLGYDS